MALLRATLYVLLGACAGWAFAAGRSLIATSPPEQRDHWQLVALDAYPREAPVPLIATDQRRLFVLRGPEGLRARGFSFTMGQPLQGLKFDPWNLADLLAARLAPETATVMAATCPPSSQVFSYGTAVLGAEAFLDASAHLAQDVELGRDLLLLSIELDPDGPAPAPDQAFPLKDLSVTYLDGAGNLHRASVDAGQLLAR